ncbi:MAG: V-type ATP synthase subunit H [Clostridia bacterium]|nr:V-type ATP synthase subunit H [Clostridia bacterium]
MTSIMERIAEAETRADEIIEEANRTARERVAKARTAADESIAAAAESERRHTAEILSQAQEDGKAIAAEVTDKAKAETHKLIEAAERNVPEAIAYLMERIEATV